MCQFIESIKVKDRHVFHLGWHQQRVNETFKKFFVGHEILSLEKVIQLPKSIEFYKLRIVYDAKNYQIEWIPYVQKEINSIEFVEVNFDYSFKFRNREQIDFLKSSSQKDEIIFIKNNYLLDSSYSNLAFYDGKEWFTPTTYLLNGTTRQRLISEQKLKATPITIQDLERYEKVSFINALNDLNENTLSLNNIII